MSTAVREEKTEVVLREPRTEDTAESGRIIYEAFRSIAERHNFPLDFANIEAGRGMAEMTITDPQIYGVIAEADGRILGSNFLWEHDEIVGVGPITIVPDQQSNGIGRKLMQNVIDRGREKAPGVRLVQDSFNTASLSLYADLGFEVVEPLVVIEGELRYPSIDDDVRVRPIGQEDFEECARLCREIHGFDRINELKQIAARFPAFVAVRERRITAYASNPGLWQLNHAVAETVEDMKNLLSGAYRLTGNRLSFLLPTRHQPELFRWCLKQGLRVVKPMTLMAMGTYREPQGSFLPSVLY